MADKRVRSGQYSDFEGSSDDDYQRKRPCERADVEVITKDSLLAAQSDDLSRVVDALAVQPRHARALLIFHRWNVERLLEKFCDKGKEVVFKEAGLVYAAPGISAASSSSESTSQANSTHSSILVKCGCCLQEALAKPSTRMDCGHSFCNECWTEYFIVNIKAGQSRRLTCMEYKCGAVCNEDEVRRLVGSKDSESVNFYDRFLLESYIEDNAKVQWCPSVPHCGNAIRVELEPFCEVQCTCGQQFCFNCLEEPHSPCSCAMWTMWQTELGLHSMKGILHAKNIKPCPKCHWLVEKDGGCNRMVCLCGQHFCWVCGLESVGRLSCACGLSGESDSDSSEYSSEEEEKEEEEKEEEKEEEEKEENEEKKEKKENEEEEEEEEKENENEEEEEKEEEEKKITSQRELCPKFLHYYYRWQEHTIATPFVEKWKHTRDLSFKKYSLRDPLQMLFTARRALSCSFVFAFYMFGNHLIKDEFSVEENKFKQDLFEDLQTQMEKTVERLTKLVETVLDDGAWNTAANMTGEVLTLISVLDKVCKNLYDIANDLLGSLQTSGHFISPYKLLRDERIIFLTG